MTTNKIDWPNFFLAILAIVLGFAAAAWGVYTLNKVLNPGQSLLCPYGYQPVDTDKPECTVINTAISTATATTSEVVK
jgi:hypothetical protein